MIIGPLLPKLSQKVVFFWTQCTCTSKPSL